MDQSKCVIAYFVTKYYTKWGERIVVTGDGEALGENRVENGHTAACRHVGDELLWEVVIPIPVSAPKVGFRLAVVNEENSVVKWEAGNHVLLLGNDLEEGDVVEVNCAWVDASHHAVLHRARAFMDVILPNAPPIRSNYEAPTHSLSMNASLRVQFRVMDFELQHDEAICITGGTAVLGNWQHQQVVWMVQTSRGCWDAEVTVPLNSFPVTYKYAVGKIGRDLMLEPGESRLIALPVREKTPSLIVQHDGFVRREYRWRGAGVAVPLFSIRTKNSVGCGEFVDIVPMAKWCKGSGFSVLQILPVADTCVNGDWRDSYPYSSLCVFALHPMYMSLENLTDHELDESIQNKILELKTQLNTKDVDYESTVQGKLRISREIFDLYGKEELSESESFELFRLKNERWLVPYAVFCFLRDLFGTAEHWNWGVFSKPSLDLLNRLSDRSNEWYDTIQFYYYLQYKLHCQLLHASEQAKKLGVVLKGDLPIGVDKRSVDTWIHSSLFRMDTSTGAPPDYFDPKGQNWGFPTYDWEVMAKDSYEWWRRRLSHMAQYFQAYRIDHILGFFRIWELPSTAKTGLLGRFRPSSPYTRSELEYSGIWDIDRLTDPYVTDEVLHDLLDDSELESEIKERFFTKSEGNRYRFKEKFNTEASLFSLKSRPGLPERAAIENERIKEILVLLYQNVLLIRDRESPNQSFFPRFGLTETSSFNHLDEHWRRKLKQMHDESFFGLRSDHIWREQAYRTLPMMQNATDMLVCGEDLGMIPSCVHPVMEELGIIGLRIQRMPSEAEVEFGNPANYGYMTVASPSSHDTTTLRAWYEEDASRRNRFSLQMLSEDKNNIKDVCAPEVVQAVINQHLQSPSILAIFAIQDVLALSKNFQLRPPDEETINVPSNPEHYWRYRMHVTVEDLEEENDLKENLRLLIAQSGRKL